MQIISDKQQIQRVQAEVLPRLIDEWALLTAGQKGNWNTMTIAWGSLGDMWWKPVVDAYVVPTRYTYEFMEAQDVFTVSFFGPEHREDLQVLGSKSGRDGDKVALTSLTPLELEQGVTFAEADTTLVCRKLYAQPLDPEAIPADVMASTYATMGTHTHYIGEIVAVIKA